MRIAELPFHERPLLELLHLEHAGVVDTQYAGFGWARAPRIWLDEVSVDDALVLALHSADDGEPLADDIELEFELAPGDSVIVHATDFLARWLPRLPRDPRAIVLAMCNPHEATLVVETAVPLHYALGNVDSWLDVDPDTRIRLAARQWCMVGA